MYDDHLYCESCGKHSAQCWCHPLDDDDYESETLCEIHNWITGENLSINEIAERGNI